MSATLFETLQVLAQPLKLKGTPKIRIDEWTFRLHYRTTSLLLVLFAALLSLREYIGAHIKCINMVEQDFDKYQISRRMLETFCFVSSTFTVPYEKGRRSFRNRPLATLLGGPGFITGKSLPVYHAYYQWVPYFLIFQAIVFYLPHAFWKAYDSGKVRNLIQDLNIKQMALERSGKCSRTAQLARYLVQSKGQHIRWATAYVTAEIVNVVVVLGSMYLTDTFIGHEFSSFGPQVLQLIEQDPELRVDPMTKVFPRVTKCTLRTFGPSGSLQRFDVLCVLSSNILNEKIFTFLWFWYVIAAVVAILAVFYRIATFLFFGMRLRCLGSADNYPEKNQGKYVIAHLGKSDWLLLRILRLNLDSVSFYRLILCMHQEMVQNWRGAENSILLSSH